MWPKRPYSDHPPLSLWPHLALLCSICPPWWTSGPLHLLSLFGTLISRKSIGSLSRLFRGSSPRHPFIDNFSGYSICIANSPNLQKLPFFLLFLQHLSPFDILYIYMLPGFTYSLYLTSLWLPLVLNSRVWCVLLTPISPVPRVPDASKCPVFSDFRE